MARILAVSNAPWCGTGYSTQIAQLTIRLKEAGHEVAIFANYGLGGSKTEWNGIRVYPSAIDPLGNDVIHGHADDWKADIVLILYDAFAMNGQILRRMPQLVCFWQPVDCEPLGRGDREQLNASGARTIAMSRFGERMLAEAGLEPLYAPHGIDTESMFVPAEMLMDDYVSIPVRGRRRAARALLREQENIPEDAFVVGMNFHNKDVPRKGVWEQMSAFSIFHHRHPDTLLMVHTMPHSVMSGHDLIGMADFLGIAKAVRWADPYSLLVGNYTQDDMAKWYARLNLYSGASRGEGFGLPLIEAQACGVPVVTTDASAMAELTGPGWAVSGQPDWHKGQQATWITPDIGELVEVYEEAYDGEAEARSEDARSFALQYDADAVFEKYWQPILGVLQDVHVSGYAGRAE
jgi:glycosyltransferase involved in cell wall biosynthesis